jgi:hypothetical protein
MGALLAAWVAEIAIITWRDLTGKAPNHTIKGMPLPADYLATFIVFGGLGFVPKDNVGASRTAALVGWAYVVATLLNVAPAIINPTSTKNTSTASSTTSTKTAPAGTTGSAIVGG